MKAKGLLTFIIVVAVAIFVIAIILAFIHSFGTPADMPAYMNHLIIILGGALATNLGAVIGITVQSGGGLTLGIREISTDPNLGIRKLCAWTYFIVLLAVFVIWWILGFEEEPTLIVDSIPMLSKTLGGVLVGAIASMK